MPLSSVEKAQLGTKERARRKKIGNQLIALKLEGTENYQLVKRIKLVVSEVFLFEPKYRVYNSVISFFPPTRLIFSLAAMLGI